MHNSNELAFVRLLCEAIGAPPKTKALTIRWHVDERLTVTAEYYPEPMKVENNELVTAIKEWKSELIERDHRPPMGGYRDTYRRPDNYEK